MNDNITKAMVDSIYNKEIQYQEESLANDEAWRYATKLVYKNINGSEFVGDDKELGKVGMDIMGKFNYNISFGTIPMSLKIEDATDEEKLAFYYMMDAYDKKDITTDGFLRAAKEAAIDPTNYIGLSTLGWGFAAKKTAATAARQGIKSMLQTQVANYLKNTTAVAATEGAAYMAADDLARQNVAVEAGVQKDIDYGQTAVSAGVGAVGGAGIVKGGEYIGKGIQKAGEKVGQFIDEGYELMSQQAGGGTPPSNAYDEQLKKLKKTETPDAVSKFQDDVNTQISKHGGLDQLDYNMMDISNRDLTRIQRVKNIIEEIQDDPENAVYTASTFNEFQDYYPEQLKYAKIVPQTKGNKVKIYRSATGDIEPGDWIGLSKKYAESHSRTPEHKTYEMWVDKEDIRWQGADANEWIYLPKNLVDADIDFKGAK